jgi:hypothetical protein
MQNNPPLSSALSLRKGAGPAFRDQIRFFGTKKDQTGDGNDMSKTWLGKWKRIGVIEGMLRVRVGAEVPRRTADRGRPSSEPSGWTGRAAP